MNNFRYLFSFFLAVILFSACNDGPAPKATNLVLSDVDVSLAEKDSILLEVSYEPKEAASETITWSSSNLKVATVSDKGLVKAISRGYALIKAQGDSLFATCEVNVTRTDLPYQLVWSEEFNGTTLDAATWNIETGGNGWGNQEKQFYTGRTDNLRIENGELIIEAKKEVYQSNNYTSARINTRDKKAFKYGKIEARISLPQGKGTWPAYWMLGSNFATARWPLCGEIDIMEHTGSQPTRIVHAVHTGDKNGSKGNNWSSYKTVADVENQFHTYAIEWEEKYNEGDDNISFFIDGVKTATIWEPHVNSTVQQWPFKQEFFVIFNIALGGTMGGTIDDNIFANPVIMKVDYLRVYQRK
jgi:beta-glucanase (GH16 family)